MADPMTRPEAVPVADALAAAAGISRLAAELLLARGITTAPAAAEFFDPDPERLHDPFRLAGAAEAAGILVAAGAAGRRVVVFGDYDVDGVTAAAQLRAALLRAGADAVAFLPHRLRDGYGLKPDTVRRVLATHRPDVIVTVDCGITAVEGVACARAAGVTVIVTDHHLVPAELPSGAIVVNPRQPGCSYPNKELAGSGLAFQLARAVARRGGFALSRESLLRAACLGTIADVVPLIGENRVIAAAGLRALAAPRAPGLAALLAAAGVRRGAAPSSEEIAYRVAPRLNAAGRLDTAELALRIFEEREPAAAAWTARELSRRNAERQAIERRVAAEVRERIRRDYDLDREAVIVESDPRWHRGVLGIVASRLAREYRRPVLLFGEEGDRASGSGRSVPEVSLHDILIGLSEFFVEFGGHDQAVGGSLPARRFAEFREAARAHFASRIPLDSLGANAPADGVLPIEAIDDAVAGELERFEPHGAGNPRPLFECSDAVLAGPPRPLGEWGLRLSLRRSRDPLPAVCWSPDAFPSPCGEGQKLALRYRLRRVRDGGFEAEIVSARRSVGCTRAALPIRAGPPAAAAAG